MSRRAVFLTSLFLAALLAPALVSAGDAADPELTDPSGDVSTTRTGCEPAVDALCPTSGPSMAPADILAAWVNETDNATFNVTVQTAAQVDDKTDLTLSFVIRPTQNSTIDSLEQNISVEAKAKGGTLQSSTAANTTLTQVGDLLIFTFTRNGTGAAGGDAITDISVSTSRTDTAKGTGEVVTGTFVGTDETGGPSRNYTLARGPIVAALAFTVRNGTIDEIPRSEYENFTAANATSMERTFNGTTVETMDPNATITFHLGITNTGTDRDTVTVILFDPTDLLGAASINVTFPGTEMPPPDSGNMTGNGTGNATGNATGNGTANQTMEPAGPKFMVTLLPNQTANLTVLVKFENATLGAHSVILSATSSRGGSTAAALSTTLLPQPVKPVTPPPAGGDGDGDGDGEPTKSAPILDVPFLRDIAEGLGMADALGDWAEVVVLAILLLLLILLVILILALVSGGAVKIIVEERSLAGKPGTQVTFPIEVRNKKGASKQVVVDLEGDPEWSAQVEFPDAPEAEDAMGRKVLNLDAKGELGSSHVGRVTVDVPEAALEGEVDRLTLSVAPVDAEGKTGSAARAGLKVAAATGIAAKGVPLRLSSVTHDPEHPTEGQIVETTATLENDSPGESLRVRVVLNVDGADLQEEVVEIPPQEARGVIFTWRPDAGSSKVRVRLYPA